MSTPFDNLAGVSVTAGTANFVISGGLDQYKSAIGAIPDATEVSYKAVYVDTANGTDYETGKGTWSSGTNTLTRVTVNTSSNSDAAVSFSGADVAVYIVLDTETLNSMANKTETTDRKILTGDERTAIAGALQEATLTTPSGIKSLSLPDSTTITAYARTLVAAATASAARVVLALGGAADLDVGTTTGTVAAGDDSRLTGTEVDSLTVTDALDGTELVPISQTGLARAATTDSVAGSPTDATLAKSRTRIRYFSHFFDTLPVYANSTDNSLWGNEPWFIRVSGSGAEVTQESVSAFTYGVAECSTGITDTGRAAIASTFHPILFSAASTVLDFRYVAFVDNPPTVTEDYIAQVGLFTDLTAAGGFGAYFRAREGQTNWQAVVKNSTGETEEDTGMAVTTFVPVFPARDGVESFRIDFDANDTTPAFRFYINGNTTPVATISITANYPTAGDALYSGAAIFKSAGTTERSIYLDAAVSDIVIGAGDTQYL